ncbi:electron transfer flavoprotein subunit alpha/FixB family protein [Paraburkholderia azotifigens]|uniref:FAD-binding protein n=1 Tax=Paraburkholderia azotifigens TaxID=2057004 RepID=A0ABU9R2Z3_9BURK
MTILVIAEHDNNCLSPVTLNVIAAARKIGANEIDVLVAGNGAHAVADEASKLIGVNRVLLADAPHLGPQLAEHAEATVRGIAREYSHVMLAASSQGKNLAPRIAANLDVAQVSDVIAIVDADTFKRPIYAGNAIATVKCDDPIKVMTVRTTAFDAVAPQGSTAAIEAVAALKGADNSPQLISRTLVKPDRPDLGQASTVVSGGRGLGSGENFNTVLAPLADKLNAALGASRAAVDAGFAPNDAQVGQTGKIVAPQLYVAVGISGAIQHLAGMKDSKVIVAINKDAEAPIFSVADYGLVGDLFQIVPDMVERL